MELLGAFITNVNDAKLNHKISKQIGHISTYVKKQYRLEVNTLQLQIEVETGKQVTELLSLNAVTDRRRELALRFQIKNFGK